MERGRAGPVPPRGGLSTPIAGAAEVEGPHAWRQSPCASRPPVGAWPPLRTGIPGARRWPRCKGLRRRARAPPPRRRGPAAAGPGVTGLAGLEAAAAQGRRLCPPARPPPATRSRPCPGASAPAAAPRPPSPGGERRPRRSGLAPLGAAAWGRAACYRAPPGARRVQGPRDRPPRRTAPAVPGLARFKPGGEGRCPGLQSLRRSSWAPA